jgi:hypothetical protein
MVKDAMGRVYIVMDKPDKAEKPRRADVSVAMVTRSDVR